MNELETQHVHEFRIRSSVLFLLIRGGIAWVMLAVSAYAFDWLGVRLLEQGSAYSVGPIVLSAETVIPFAPLFHLAIHAAYGALVLFITLSWIYEFSMIKKTEILTHQGIIFSQEHVYEMEDIKTIEVLQGFWGKLCNTGTVRLYAHRAGQYVLLRNVGRPHSIAARIRELHPAPDALQATSGKQD